MRFALMVAAAAFLGLSASADGVGSKAVTAPALDHLTATDEPAAPGHERYKYRHGATYKVDASSTPLACEAACGSISCRPAAGTGRNRAAAFPFSRRRKSDDATRP